MCGPSRRWKLALVVAVHSSLLAGCGKSTPGGSTQPDGSNAPPITAPSRPLEPDLAGYGVIALSDAGTPAPQSRAPQPAGSSR